MEPKLPAPNFQPDQSPVAYEHNVDRTHDAILEVPSERNGELASERRGEASAQQVPMTPVLPPPVVVSPPKSPVAAAMQPDVTTGDTPMVAADEDLIEKEWVDKAKKIVEATKDDPYKREQEVSKLQADYLRKRYGKELGTS